MNDSRQKAEGNLIGGIYSKPVAIGNFGHFLVGGLALLKEGFKETGMTEIWILAGIYLTFAICFGYVLVFNPVIRGKSI